MDQVTQIFSVCSALTFSSALLSLLPPDEINQLRPFLTRVQWVNGQVLHEAGERIEHVYFVEQGLVSLVAMSDNPDAQTEVGLIGRESLLGLPALLGPEPVSFNRAIVQVSGSAHRMTVQALRDGVDVMPVLRRLLFQALAVALAQTAQTAACNSRHDLPQRLARWLLTAHDRVDGDELALTHESLATMLAVRRSGVTVTLGALQEVGAVARRRGRILIRDRSALEAAACSCYERVQAFEAVVTGNDRDGTKLVLNRRVAPSDPRCSLAARHKRPTEGHSSPSALLNPSRHWNPL